ncbi:MAG: ATP-binding cassette domain-containing protein [Chloroflexi bacterium]|nr:ATP-binding cassette domain-containing protein [Chloroflexota bacterium]
MIEIKRFTYAYPGTSTPVLRDLSLAIDEGEFVLVTGASGAGKSTFLRALNGLVPHFTGGTCAGQVRVAGHDALREGPQVLSRYVGFVFQDPEAQFVVDRVEDEVAFALEQRAVPPPQMREQVQGALALLGLLSLRDRPLDSLSGGERQRVALAAALALRPRLLVLDEPTSQLDPQAAHDLLGTLVRMNRDLGITVVLAEHRLERVLQYVDRLVHLTCPGGPVLHGTPREVLPAIDLAPPVVSLGIALGWAPLPLSVSEALPMARAAVQGAAAEESIPPAAAPPSPEPILTVRGLAHGYGGAPVLRGVDLDVRAGELVALLGPNGAGKTTLLRALVGLLRPEAGDVRLAGRSIIGRATADICAQVAYLPQQPDDLLFADTVREELEVTLRNHSLLQQPPVAPEDLLARLGLAALAEAYPRDLSVGQRQRVALAAVTVTRPPLLLLDEPTRGMDYAAKQGLVRLLRGWQEEGSGVLMVTHDVELAAAAADRVLLLDGGRIVAEGSPARVLSGAERFAPQTAQLFPGRGWLTPEAALRALPRRPERVRRAAGI